MAESRPAARPPRVRVDLRRTLPRRAQYALAAAVIGIVAMLGWWVGRDEPVPGWITRVLVPLLGWAWLALAGAALVTWVLGRRSGVARDDAAPDSSAAPASVDKEDAG